jgi:hypothetical protein
MDHNEKRSLSSSSSVENALLEHFVACPDKLLSASDVRKELKQKGIIIANYIDLRTPLKNLFDYTFRRLEGKYVTKGLFFYCSLKD